MIRGMTHALSPIRTAMISVIVVRIMIGRIIPPRLAAFRRDASAIVIRIMICGIIRTALILIGSAMMVAVVVRIMVRGIIRAAISDIRTAMTSAIVVRIMIGRIIRTALDCILAAMTSAIIVRIMIRQIVAATTASHHRAPRLIHVCAPANDPEPRLIEPMPLPNEPPSMLRPNEPPPMPRPPARVAGANVTKPIAAISSAAPVRLVMWFMLELRAGNERLPMIDPNDFVTL